MPTFVPQSVPRQHAEPEPEPAPTQAQGPGQRKAGARGVAGELPDPLAELAREVLGNPDDEETIQALCFRVASDVLDFLLGRVGDFGRSPNGSLVHETQSPSSAVKKTPCLSAWAWVSPSAVTTFAFIRGERGAAIGCKSCLK